MAFVATVNAQIVSGDSLSSEDEILTALILGEIDYDEYLTLLEILEDGKPFDSAFASALAESISLPAHLTVDSADLVPASERRALRGRWRSYAITDPERSTPDRATHQVDIQSVRWSAKAAIVTNEGEGPLWRSRGVRYRSRWSALDDIALGDADFVWGLGMVYGRRRAILDSDGNPGAESFLRTHRGGVNGLLVGGAVSSGRYTAALSTRGDAMRELRSSAFGYIVSPKRFHFGALVARNAIIMDGTQSRYEQTQWSLTGGFEGRDTECELEVADQYDGTHRLSGATLVKHRGKNGMNVSAQGWRYPRGFVNLTGAGPSAKLYETTVAPDVDLEFRDRRGEQTGAQALAQYPVNEVTRVRAKTMFADADSAESYGEYSLALSRELSQNTIMTIEGRGVGKRVDGAEANDHRLRVLYERGGRSAHSPAAFYGRVYMERLFVNDGAQAWAMYGRVERRWSDDIRINVRTLLSRWEPSTGVKRFSTSLSFWSTLLTPERLSLGVKVTYRYASDLTDENDVSLRSEVLARL